VKIIIETTLAEVRNTEFQIIITLGNSSAHHPLKELTSD
jgi:hypothetical protein